MSSGSLGIDNDRFKSPWKPFNLDSNSFFVFFHWKPLNSFIVGNIMIHIQTTRSGEKRLKRRGVSVISNRGRTTTMSSARKGEASNTRFHRATCAFCMNPHLFIGVAHSTQTHLSTQTYPLKWDSNSPSY